MLSRTTVLLSNKVQVGMREPQAAWDEALRKLFIDLHTKISEEFDSPITIELKEKREDWTIWVEARVKGKVLGRRGKNWKRYYES